ncbi:hypothetical protein C4J81_13740 [Deltaproteobacteria bacterium Smac51]|nr:hypothetical protein C4J81_13740 [Deltaproteobacteria bacterium Smac51]
MSIVEDMELAEKLRLHILSFPDFPVKGGQFSLDMVLGGTGQSMSLQINPGQYITKYIDGSGTVRQPFTLYYGSSATDMNKNKSAMMGILNSIGKWMERQGSLDLGDDLRPIQIEQVTSASVYEQDNVTLAYAAQYVLDYETT